MPKIKSPEAFAPNQVLGAEDLQNHVDGSYPLPGFITEHPPYATSNTVASDDKLIISDTSDSSILRVVNASEILNSGLDASFGTSTATTVVSSSFNGKSGSDINQTPNDAPIVTGKAFTSIDGINAVVTSTAHNLQSNSLLEFSASDAVYSGQYFITVINADTFSYVISQATPTPSSGTLSYIKKGTVKTTGSQHISNKLHVVGDAKVVGNLTSSGNLTSNGTANFTGAFQLNGATAYALTEIVEESIPNATGAAANTLHTMFTSASYTKPEGEIWLIEFDATLYFPNNGQMHYRLTDSSDTINYVIGYDSVSSNWVRNHLFRVHLNSSNTHTGTFVFRIKHSATNVHITPDSTQISAIFPDKSNGSIGYFRIYKYKTA